MLKPIIALCQQAFAWLLPPTCPGCMALLPATEPVGFCATCFGQMPWWNKNLMLAPPLPPAINSFTAPCLYDGPLRHAILHLKFHDALPFIPALSKLLQPHVPSGEFLIVPVPSHASRIRKRRYNHAAHLAQHLAKRTSNPCNVTSLKRVKMDNPQASKTRAQRLKLAATAFSANPNAFKGRDILLIDDIYTTGATCRACALALRKAGAKSVHVLTLAYTAPGS